MPAPEVDALAVTLLCEHRARALFAGRRLRLRMLVPPYRGLGCGALRVLRVRDAGDVAEVVAGYDRYERVKEPVE